MLDRPAAKTAAVSAALSLASYAFAKRYPASRVLVALPLIKAGLDVLKAKQRADQVRELRQNRVGGLLRKLS